MQARGRSPILRFAPMSANAAVVLFALAFAGGALAAALRTDAVADAQSRPAASRPAQPTTGPAERATPQDDPAAAFAGGIIGSQHDFSAAGAVPRDLCLPCHTPHISASAAPLLISGADVPRASYKTAGGQLNAASLVCLSCHDGVIARDVYAGSHGASWSDLAMPGHPAGQARWSSHPVGIEYPAAAEGYASPQAVIQGGLIKLPENRIQCTTCHDPHNTARHAGMLVISNERSRLCLACHRL